MSRGGSRYGAGRPASHLKTGAAIRLGVRDLQRHGAFKCAAATVGLTWSNGATIRAHVAGDSVTLEYQFKFAEGWRDISKRVGIERTPCHYGGARLWFRCPRCQGRTASLYLRGWPGCRKCSRLVYASQSDDALARSWRRTHRLEKRLSGGGGQWDYRRPKGMRQATFTRLWGEWCREDECRDNLLAEFLEKAAPEMRERLGL